MTVVVDGIGFGESLRWHDGAVWFSDWARGQVNRVGADGEVVVMADVASFPLCFDFLPDGQMLLVDSARSRLLRREHDGSLHLHADLSGFCDPPWNDIVVADDGFAYVNTIGYDFPHGEPGPGSIVGIGVDGHVTRVADQLAFPNGMAITDDGSTLIVAESHGNRLTGFTVGDDGALGEGWLWAATGDDHPDGICIDGDGAVWYADVAHQHCARVTRGGEVLDTVRFDRGAFDCVLDESGRGLYVIGQQYGPPTDHPTGRLSVVELPRAGVAGR